MRSVSDQSQFLLSRRVAEARRSGAMSPDAEALALFESIALNLLLYPRSVLLFAILARNGLRKAVLDERSVISDIKSALEDLGNVSLDVTSTKQLKTARTALLRLEELDRISTDHNQYKKFDTSVSEFLNKVISKSVRRPGASSLVRPGTEASLDFASSLESLNDLHSDLLDRLYAIAVGVNNFLTSPIATVIGLTTAARARSDIEELIQNIEENGSVPADRDMAIRLITDRAAVKTIGSLPNIFDPVIDSTRQLPLTYSLKAASDLSIASIQSLQGPFALPAAAKVAVAVNGVSIPLTNFPQTDVDLNNKAAIVGSPISFPISIPPNSYLFVVVDGVSHKIGPLTSGSTSKSAFLADIAAKISSSTLSGELVVKEFVQPGTDRILIYANTASQLRIIDLHVGSDTDIIGGSQATTPSLAVYDTSIHGLIGFEGTEIGYSGATTTQFVVDALNYIFGSIVTATRNDDSKFTVATNSSAIGTSMTIDAPAVLGISGTFKASSSTFRLYGTVLGVPTDPVSPVGLLDIGDVVETPTGTEKVVGITASRVTLSNSIPTFDGNIVVKSALTLAYQSMEGLLKPFLEKWLTEDFASDLKKLAVAASSIRAGAPQSQRNVVLGFLNRLDQQLVDLLSRLDDPSAVLPSRSASKERIVVDGITSSLEERKFDKALSLFLRCKIQEALESTVDTASFGGTLLKAISDFARTDMVVPNRALDEGLESTHSQEIKGL
jgi:hypothetical protein